MCTKPLVATKFGIDSETGKMKLKLNKHPSWSLDDYYRRYGRENVFLIPCGHCSECILHHRKEWSVRCQLEAMYHEKNCFITLTYDNEHNPLVLNKSDLKKFIKSIRNSGYKVRYFGCGEYGKNGTLRPHYHIILFGFQPDDLFYIGESESGEALYQSDFIDAIWAKGRAVVQLCGDNVGQYVAGYTSKKLGDTDGFQIQSTRPGIGYQFFYEKGRDLWKYNKMFGRFGSSKVPRYFEKLLDDPFWLELMKEQKANISEILMYQEARDHGLPFIDLYFLQKRWSSDRKLSLLERSL